MKFLYPKKGSNLDQRKNSSIYGNYPLSSYNTWHGGTHEETRLAPLVAISDARIIAYKLPSEYLFTAHECPEMYSNGFILLQHDYKSPKEKELTFYSLYHHIASKFDITHNKLEVPSFLSKKVTKITASYTPKGVRGRSASLEEGKTRGAETVLIPKNHVVTRNGVELLADWAKTYNIGKTRNKKYHSYTYTDPFTNTVYSDIHIYTGCLQLVAGETDKYKITYETDTNTTTGKSKKQTDALNAELKDGALLYHIADSDFGFFGKGTCIGVIPKDTEVTVIEGSESEDKKWARVKDSEKEYDGYVQVRDFEVQKAFDSDIELDKIIACDIPVKAGEIVAYVGAFGFHKNENNYSSHIELFTDASDTDVSDLLDNCAGDGEENFQRYKMLSGATLEPYVQSSKELKAGTPIRVTSTTGDYVRVKVKALIKEIDKSKHLAAQQTTNASGKKVYVKDSVCGMSKTRYKIKDTSFDYVNQQFNGLLTKGDFVYYYKSLAGSLREIIIQPPFWNKEFWIDKSHLKVEGDQVVTFGLETTLESDSCHTYIGEPYTPHERGNTFKKERELSGKPQKTVTDDDGKLWYWIAESYNFEKECYQHIGWIKADDAHLELINPFVWSNFGFKTYDAGSEYVYAMKDYHKSEKTDAFIDELWKMVDEDGDGILNPMEFLRAQRNPYTSERMGKMVVKHKSEWSYDPEKIKSEALEFYKLGIDLEKDPDKKKLLEQKRDADLEHLVEKAKNLMFWTELQNTTYTPKITEKDKEYEEKKAAIRQKYTYFLGEEHMSENSKTKMNVELDVLDQEYKKGKYKKETRRLPSSDMLWHFNVNSFVRQMRGIYGSGCKPLKKGDKNELVRELNIRLSGFGGNVPTDEFTDRTVTMVKQFQKDYMQVKPTGIVCGKMFKAIDEFSDKYNFDFDNLKCPCGVCDGYGRGLSSSQKQKSSVLEKNRAYEYPGIHRSLVWTLKSTLFYLEKESTLNLKFGKISSGYRCQENNRQKRRRSTNHMGKAIDVHFYKKNGSVSTEQNCDLVRDKILIAKSGAKLRWSNSNVFSLEPSTKDRIGTEFIAKTWVHFDTRSFKLEFLKDHFFVKTSEKAINGLISKLASQNGYNTDCSCENKKLESTNESFNRVTPSSLSFSDKGVEFLKSYESEIKKDGKHALYDDDSGYCTIGYGHLVGGKKKCDSISDIPSSFKNGLTDSEAKDLLKQDIKTHESGVKQAVKVNLHKYEFDALVSLSFNIGKTNFKTSTLVRKLNSSKYEEASQEFVKWNKSGGVVLNGLTKRREAEAKIFKSNTYDSTH